MILIKLHREGQSLFAELPPTLSNRERGLLLEQAFKDARDNALLDHPRSKEGAALLAKRKAFLSKKFKGHTVKIDE